MEDKDLSHEESLRLINSMINKAKNSYHDTGVGPMLWGSVISICSIITFLEIHYSFKMPFDTWMLTIIAIVPQIFISVKENRMSKAKAYGESTMDALWLCFGIGIFILSFISGMIIDKIKPVFDLYLATTGKKADFSYSSFSNAFFLLWYGFPTIITGVLRKFKPMLYGGILCWVLCVLSVFTKIETDMLFMATAAIFAWLIPGIILWKRYQKRKVENGL